jgi:hypothetical protein
MWNDLSHFLLVQLKEFGITFAILIAVLVLWFFLVNASGKLLYYLLKK